MKKIEIDGNELLKEYFQKLNPKALGEKMKDGRIVEDLLKAGRAGELVDIELDGQPLTVEVPQGNTYYDAAGKRREEGAQ